MPFWDQPGQTMVLPTKTQQQQNALNFGLNYAQKGLENLNPSFEPIQQAANRNYAQQAVPNLSAFLASQGIEPGGSASDAAYKSAFNDFQLKSLGQRAQFEQNQQANLTNLLGTGLNTSAFENIYQPPQQGFASAAAPGVAHAITSYGASALSNYLNPSNAQQAAQAAQQAQQGSNVAGTVGNVAAGTAGTIAGSAAAKTAAAGGGLVAALSNPWFWGPIAAVAGGYLLYKGGKWIYDKYMTAQQANKLSAEAEARRKQYIASGGTQGGPEQQASNQNPSIAQRLQTFAAPSFA